VANRSDRTTLSQSGFDSIRHAILDSLILWDSGSIRGPRTSKLFKNRKGGFYNCKNDSHTFSKR
jgi:hypothetical protein